MEEYPHSVQIPLETESDTCPTRPNRKHSSTETHREPTAKHLQRQRKQSRDDARTSEICPLASFRFGRVRTESIRRLQRQRLPWKGGSTTPPRSNHHATDATAVAMNHKYADAKFENIQREMCGKRDLLRTNGFSVEEFRTNEFGLSRPIPARAYGDSLMICNRTREPLYS